MAHKFKVHCNIMHYLEQEYPDIAYVIKGACCENSLTSLKGKPGITFLMPTDKSVISELEKLAFSEDVKDLQKAADMINAMIIKDVFKKPSDWMDKRDDIPNALYPSQHVEVDKTTANEVIFKSGAKAVIDEKFRDASRNKEGDGKLAVWKLTGKIPIDGKPAQMKYAKAARAIKKGGGNGDQPIGQSQKMRLSIITKVENEYVFNQLNKRAGDPYLNATMGLICYILHSRNDETYVYERVLPFISFDKIDLYILLEPYRCSGTHLIDDRIIQDWAGASSPMGCQAMVNEVQELLKKKSGAQIYSDRSALLGKIMEVRKNLYNEINSRTKFAADAVCKAYEELENSNNIKGFGPVYPQSTANFYSSNKGLKAMHDELRYITTGMFDSLERRGFDLGSFNEIVHMIAHGLACDGKPRRHVLLNSRVLQSSIMPTEKVNEIRTFVYSTMFCFVPMTKEESLSLIKGGEVRRPDPNEVAMWNIQQMIYERLPRRLSEDQDIMKMLEALSPDALEMVKRKVQGM